MGLLHMSEGDYEKAITVYESALAQRRNFMVGQLETGFLATLAVAEYFSGRIADARKHTVEALRSCLVARHFVGSQTVLGSINLLLAHDGEIERAIEFDRRMGTINSMILVVK